MSATLAIHSMAGLDDVALNCFRDDGPRATCTLRPDDPPGDRFWHCETHWNAVALSSNVQVGDVSWLKAALLEKSDRYVPDTIGTVEELLSGPVVMTQDLVRQVDTAFELPNNSTYPIHPGVRDVVRSFLEGCAERGERVFTVSW